MALVLSALIHGEDRGTVLSQSWEPLVRLKAVKPLHPLIDNVVNGSFRDKTPPAIRGSGWVVQSLEAALWAFHDASSFEEAVLKGVNLGEDADTTGAVVGQVAGAFWGESGIPAALLEGLARYDMLDTALVGLIGKDA
jgi:ADP-ribosyl-[dinitrogen reductase] hydrolase